MLQTFLSLVVCLGMASSRDNIKTSQPMPVMSNSFVNLGKIDVTFHINSKAEIMPNTHGLDIQPGIVPQPLRSSFFSHPETLMEECPCSSASNIKNSLLRNPSSIVNKILASNELFPNHEPAQSVNCCDSHENVHEDTVIFEIGPKAQSQKDATSILSPILPFIFEKLIPKRPMLPALPIKHNAMEILLFPKEETSLIDNNAPSNKIETTKKAEIQKVGDKELRNDFKTYKYRPSIPVVSSLMKKEVNPDQMETKTTSNSEVTSKVTVKNLNAL